MLKPASNANTKLGSYPRKNRTNKALRELDNLLRSLHLLNYVDSPEFQRNIQRARNRGESYHKLVHAVAYATGENCECEPIRNNSS